VLFLMPSARAQFLPFIEKQFPRLARRFRDWYGRAAYPPEEYRKEIGRRVAALRRKYGLAARPPEIERPSAPATEQLEMDWARLEPGPGNKIASEEAGYEDATE
jgi:hypothetical protein